MNPSRRTSLARVFACALIAGCLLSGCASKGPAPRAAASAQALFDEKLSLADAGARAAFENKKIFAVFDSSGPGENTGMDIAMLGAESVAAILQARTIPVLLDATEAPDISSKYHIKSLPTFLLLDADGNELERWINEDEPGDFSQSLKDALDGNNSVERLRAKLNDRNVRGHLNLARKLNTSGRYEEALKEYIWICDVGHPPHVKYSMPASNNSRYFNQAIGDMVAMQKAFPAAKDALIDRRRLSEDALYSQPESSMNARRYIAINRALRDERTLTDTFYKLADGRGKNAIKPEIFILLAKDKKYDDAVAIWSLDEALASMEKVREAPLVLRGFVRVLAPSRGGAFIKQYQFQLLQKRAVYFSVYAAAGNIGDARLIAGKIIKWDRFSRAPEELRRAAKIALGDKADAFLNALDIPALNDAGPKSL